MRARSLAVAALALAALVLSACGESVSDDYERESEPYTVEEVAEGQIPRGTLVPSAVQRLGIETVEVRSLGETLVVPADAVYLHADGTFWVYTNPEPNVYLRGGGRKPQDVVLVWGDSSASVGGTVKSASVTVTGDDFRAYNLTIQNDWSLKNSQQSQAVALAVTRSACSTIPRSHSS